MPHSERDAHEPELEHVLGRRRRPDRRGLVRRDAHPAVEPPLPGGQGGDVVMGVTVFRWIWPAAARPTSSRPSRRTGAR
ncbi:MAG: hypothetical protein MZU84_06350 [Sphingobacterium sp.]|nr:hypothetical protein [Sphingobacterium sp.]